MLGNNKISSYMASCGTFFLTPFFPHVFNDLGSLLCPLCVWECKESFKDPIFFNIHLDVYYS
jgi:hypothetical protein